MRDNYIDFLKGLAALNIILIHTAFWSGGPYVSQEIQTATLILDVPFFFFLSGWGTASSPKIDLRKRFGSLLHTYGKYVQFVIFLYGFMLLFNAVLGIGINGKRGFIDSFVRNLFFVRSEIYRPSIDIIDALWFLPVFFSVVPLMTILLSAVNKREEKGLVFTLFLVVCIGTGYVLSTGKAFYLLGLNTLFYSIFFLLGYMTKDVTLKWRGLVCSIFIIPAVLWAYGYIAQRDVTNMQSLKFPPTLAYCLYSCITICLALFFKKYGAKIKRSNLLALVGRHALSFYFCQSISSSILYRIAPLFHFPVYIKLPLCFLINLCMAAALVLLWTVFSRVADHLLGLLRRKDCLIKRTPQSF
ncbi:acyltransferase [Ruminococcaceae bacterium OttesenSCG-928-O06]|nr:acyltransferase [Ruminococcaceae bacterium OttesenSCG-928-O06]